MITLKVVQSSCLLKINTTMSKLNLNYTPKSDGLEVILDEKGVLLFVLSTLEQLIVSVFVIGIKNNLKICIRNNE